MELKLHDSSENRRMKAIRKSLSGVLCLVLFSGSGIAAAQPLVLNETPAGDGERGYHPADGSVSQVNPPSFSWCPQENLRWELECSHDSTLGGHHIQRTRYRIQRSLPPSHVSTGNLHMALSRERCRRPVHELEQPAHLHHCSGCGCHAPSAAR